MFETRIRPGGPLGAGYSRIFNQWLDDSSASGASAELGRALQGETPSAGQLFVSPWAPQFTEAVTFDQEQAARLQHNREALANGSSGVVVTGQQPGIGGGPLYTLFKIATAVALAEQRTRQGFPTIPVFWSADDDTDLSEALAPVFWDHNTQQLRSGSGRKLLRQADSSRRMVGTLPCPDVCDGVGPWLADLASDGDDSLVKDLSLLYNLANTESWSLARLNTAIWYRCFRHSDLLVVSGNDQGLHAVAEPFTRQLRLKTADLVNQAQEQGQKLVERGGHAQLTARSLRSPWYQVVDERRLPLANEETVSAGALRPGVLMRSMIQDWLLAPVAVVVGPGEYAYLQQLAPLYESLELERSPLIPRLTGRLVPEDWTGPWSQLTSDSRALADHWAQDFITGSQAQLTSMLQQKLGMDEARSRKLALARTQRWQRGLSAMLAGLARENHNHAGLPPWVCPQGQNQERALATFNALGLWGSNLLSAVGRGALSHLEKGLAGQWLAMAWEVDNPGARN